MGSTEIMQRDRYCHGERRGAVVVLSAAPPPFLTPAAELNGALEMAPPPPRSSSMHHAGPSPLPQFLSLARSLKQADTIIRGCRPAGCVASHPATATELLTVTLSPANKSPPPKPYSKLRTEPVCRKMRLRMMRLSCSLVVFTPAPAQPQQMAVIVERRGRPPAACVRPASSAVRRDRGCRERKREGPGEKARGVER